MDIILIEHKNHDIYFSLAKENLISAEEVYQEILASNKVVSLRDVYLHTDGELETSYWLNSKLLRLKKFVVASIIFSALTAEAFINFYAMSKGITQGMTCERLEKDFRSKSYKVEELTSEDIEQQYKLPYEQRTTIKEWIVVKNKDSGVNISSTVRKWIEIPKIYTGQYIPSGLNGYLIYELDELFKLRNVLAHHKATIARLSLDEPDLESVKDKNYVSLRKSRWAIETLLKVFNALQYIDSSVDLNWLTNPI